MHHLSDSVSGPGARPPSPSPNTSAHSQQSWAIVGGGMLGLTLAYRLAQAGEQVTLFEAAPELGGLASAWEFGGTVWDRHYHVTLLSDLQLRSLLSDLDLESEMVWRKTKTGVYARQKLYSVSNAVEFLQFPVLGWLDKFRLAFTLWYGSKIKNGERLEQISVVDWLRRWSGDRTFKRFWLPLLRSKLGSNYRKASAAFIWATIARLYAARSAGLKEERFGYLPGGYQRLLKQFSQRLQESGVSLQLGQRVNRIHRIGHCIGHCIERGGAGPFQVELEQGAAQHFDQVVVTAAAPIAAQLCPQLTAVERDRLTSIEYQGIVCASLLLRRPLSPYYVTNITDDGFPFTGVIEMTTLVDSQDFGGNHLIYLPKYLPANDPALYQPEAEVQQSFLSALGRMYPDFQPEDLLDFKLSRVKYVMAVPTLNYSQQVPPFSTSVAGLHLVTSAQIVNATLNVNDTLKLAERAIPELLSRSRFEARSTVIA